MKKLLILAVTAAALVLSACGSKDEAKKASGTETPAAQSTAGDAAVTVGGISLGSESLEYIKKAMGENASDDDVKEQAENMCKIVAIGRGMKLEEDESRIEEMKNSYTGQGMPEELAGLLAATQLMSEEIETVIKKELAGADPSLIEKAKEGKWRAKHVLVLTQDVSEAELPSKKKLAEEILKKAQAGEDFDKLVEEYGEDPGMKSNPDGYVFGEGEMVKEFEEGVKNTPVGEFTLVKTDYGYHIIQPLEIDDEAAISAIDITEDQYEDFINKKAAEYNIEQ